MSQYVVHMDGSRASNDGIVEVCRLATIATEEGLVEVEPLTFSSLVAVDNLLVLCRAEHEFSELFSLAA